MKIKARRRRLQRRIRDYENINGRSTSHKNGGNGHRCPGSYKR